MQRIVAATLLALALGGCGKADWDNSMTEQSSSSTVVPTLGLAGPGDVMVQLRWQANTDPIAGYRVYYGPTEDQATVQISDLSPTTSGFDPQSPHVTYHSQRDLGLRPGSAVCFRLRAYNSQQALSPWSTPACGTI